jgi:hypothetical protein
MKIKARWTSMLVVLALVGAHPRTVEAKELTAGDLQQICSTQDPDIDAPCRFYILGILQGISIGIGMADGKVTGGRPCIPDDIQDSKIETLVKAKLGADLMVYPHDKDLPASSFVASVIATTFACRKAN